MWLWNRNNSVLKNIWCMLKQVNVKSVMDRQMGSQMIEKWPQCVNLLTQWIQNDNNANGPVCHHLYFLQTFAMNSVTLAFHWVSHLCKSYMFVFIVMATSWDSVLVLVQPMLVADVAVTMTTYNNSSFVHTALH